MSTPHPPTHEDATRYEVSCLPIGHAARRHFTITVEWRGVDSWGVFRDGYCYSPDSGWTWESIPSERQDLWIALHRFPLSFALQLAHLLAPGLTVMGRDVQFALDNPEWV